jgi:hypothetical protein
VQPLAGISRPDPLSKEEKAHPKAERNEEKTQRDKAWRKVYKSFLTFSQNYPEFVCSDWQEAVLRSMTVLSLQTQERLAEARMRTQAHALDLRQSIVGHVGSKANDPSQAHEQVSSAEGRVEVAHEQVSSAEGRVEVSGGWLSHGRASGVVGGLTFAKCNMAQSAGPPATQYANMALSADPLAFYSPDSDMPLLGSLRRRVGETESQLPQLGSSTCASPPRTGPVDTKLNLNHALALSSGGFLSLLDRMSSSDLIELRKQSDGTKIMPASVF